MNSAFSQEISRKVLHLFSSIIPLGYLWLIQDKGTMVLILASLSLVAIFVEMGRKYNSWVKKVFTMVLNFMLRDNELAGSLTGATWLLFGSTLTILLFPIHIAVPALLFLTVGDTFAAIVGKLFPVGRIKQKTLSGTFAGIISSIGVAGWVNQILQPEIIILGAVIAMAVEVSPIPLNDNLTIPLSGGLAMSYGLMVL